MTNEEFKKVKCELYSLIDCYNKSVKLKETESAKNNRCYYWGVERMMERAFDVFINCITVEIDGYELPFVNDVRIEHINEDGKKVITNKYFEFETEV